MRTLTDDVLTVLGAEVGDGTGEGLEPPFRVLYPLPQSRGGTLDDGWSDVTKQFQVTCEAGSRGLAEWWADRTEDQLVGSDLVLSWIQRAETVRDDTTGDASRWKAYVRFQVRSYWPVPTGYGHDPYGTSGYGG